MLRGTKSKKKKKKKSMAEGLEGEGRHLQNAKCGEEPGAQGSGPGQGTGGGGHTGK